MTLDSLIRALERERMNLPVYIDAGGCPSKLRKYKQNSVLCEFHTTPITVAELLEKCIIAASNIDISITSSIVIQSSYINEGLALMDVVCTDSKIKLVTKQYDWEFA